jgi:2-keto-4-pentenoate hydratase
VSPDAAPAQATQRQLDRGRAGESLEAGDRTLTPPQPVAAGDRAAVDLGRLGRLEVEFVS